MPLTSLLLGGIVSVSRAGQSLIISLSRQSPSIRDCIISGHSIPIYEMTKNIDTPNFVKDIRLFQS